MNGELQAIEVGRRVVSVGDEWMDGHLTLGKESIFVEDVRRHLDMRLQDEMIDDEGNGFMID